MRPLEKRRTLARTGRTKCALSLIEFQSREGEADGFVRCREVKEGEEDAEMDLEGDATAAATAMAQTLKVPTGPDDLSAYNLDDYDEEVSKGAGTFLLLVLRL